MKQNNPERIAKAVECIMTNLTGVHDDLVTAIAKSDMTPTGIIASINNNVYPISNIMYVFVESAINTELARIYADKTLSIVGGDHE